MNNLFRTPVLTRRRIALAFMVAVAGDMIQAGMGPAGMIGASQAVDVVVMIIASALLGFHPLFLPTFVAEFVPVVDMLPTWTGCVAVVSTLRWKQQQQKNQAPDETGQPPRQPQASQPPRHDNRDVIDI